jgi:3-dehydro-4-phosphotetronate decarboxylase
MNDEAALREAICRIGRSLFERGYVHATAGNISVRLPDGFLITPTDASLGFLQPAMLARVDAEGRQVAGEPASKTLALHRRIYAAEPQALAVLHTHSSELVALTLSGCWQTDAVLPPITPYFVMKVGRVPLVPYHRPGDPAVGEWIARAIHHAQAAGAPLRAVLCDRLGPVVWHQTLDAAMAALEELEETAHLWRLAGDRKPAPLSDAQIEELRAAFDARW